MDLQQRSRRFGLAMIACVLAARFFTSGLPGWIVTQIRQLDIAPFLIYLETGRDVRFSASREVFWPFSPESARPMFPEEPDKPVFSPEDTALTDIYYACALRPDMETLVSQPLSWDLADGDPAVLILHTHTTESYTQGREPYVESSDYRTLDEGYNMLSIGARVAEILEENGIRVLQDRNLHDYPSYNGSYTDARISIADYLEKYPTIRLVLDLHRDASDGANGQLRTEVALGDETCAQLMLVMGTNASGQSHENWQENLSLALKLQAQLERQVPGITRPTILRAQRFNQDLSPGALLVEVGAAGNTHPEALRAAEELAKAIVALSKGTKSTQP